MALDVEFDAPDISHYQQGNCGIDYVHQFDSGLPGPHVVISAVIHGNEICGAVILDHLLKEGIRPLKGRITLAFCNIAAFQRFDPRNPYYSRFVDQDMNRLWDETSLKSVTDTIEKKRVQELLPIFEEADYLLDLHSMGDVCSPLTLSGPSKKGLELAKAVGYPELIVIDEGHAAGKRLRDFAPFNAPDTSKASILVECGQHWQESSVTTAMETTYRFLHHFEMLPPDTGKVYMSDVLSQQKALKVIEAITVQNNAFFFDIPAEPLALIEKAGTLLGKDGDQPIRTPVDNCYLIMPQQGATHGQTAVRLAIELDT